MLPLQQFILHKKWKTKRVKKFRWAAIACALVLIGLTYYYFFSAFSAKDEVEYVYIDKDDNIDSVYQKLKPIATEHWYGWS